MKLFYILLVVIVFLLLPILIGSQLSWEDDCYELSVLTLFAWFLIGMYILMSYEKNDFIKKRCSEHSFVYNKNGSPKYRVCQKCNFAERRSVFGEDWHECDANKSIPLYDKTDS